MTSSSSANTQSRQIARNAAANYATLLSAVVSGIVVTPFLVRGLGESAFGTFALAMTIASYMGLLELGIGTATLREVAVRSATGDADRMPELLGSARALYTPVAVLSALALVPVIVLAPLLPGAAGADVTEVRLVIAALGAGQIFNLLMNVYPAYVFGSGRADLLLGVGVIFSLATSAAQATVAITDGGVVLLAIATAGVTIVNTAVVGHLAKRMLDGMSVRRREGTSTTKRYLVRLGLKNAGVALTAVAGSQSDLLVVGAFLSPQRVAAYAVASRAANFARSVATRASDVLVPTFADAAAKGDSQRQFQLYVEASLVGIAILIPLAISAVAFGQGLLELWLGSVPAGAEAVFALLVAAAAIQAAGQVSYVFFNGRGELEIFLRLGAFVAAGNLVVSVVLTKAIGLTGPALGSLAAFLIFDLAILPAAVARRLSRSPRDFAREAVAVLLPPTLVAVLVVLVWWSTVGDSGIAAVAGSALAGLTFGATLIWSAGAQRRERYRRLFTRKQQDLVPMSLAEE